MAIHNNIRMQDYAKRDVSDPSTKKTEAEKQKEEMERQRETDANMVGMTPSTGASGAQTNGGGNQTDSKDYIAMLLGGLTGDYNTSYWDKNQNALLSNNRWGLNKATEHEKDYRSLINEYKNTNPLETDWGKAIMSQYGLDGDNAAKSEWADAAASNGGNIDSYAEANARRQKLSYLNSGINAVNDASNQRFSNMLGALEKMGVNTQNLFGISSQNVQTGMNAAQDRYAQDTTSTLAYNEMVQNLLPTLMGSEGTAARLTVDDRKNIRETLQKAYENGGEQMLLDTGKLLAKDYDGYSGISDVIGQYVDNINGQKSSASKKSKTNYPYELLEFYVKDADDISALPEDVRNQLREEADAKGTTVLKYAQGILSGEYTRPSWIAAPYKSNK